MRAIGIDTHKATLAACAVDELGRPLSERTFRNDPAGHLRLAAWWRKVVPDAVIGIEGSSVFGAALGRMLVTNGADVRDVPAHLTGDGRRVARRRGKSDPGDALVIARTVLRERGLPPVRLTGRSTDLALLMAAREALVVDATRDRNRLHAHLVVLVPGYQARVDRLVSAVALTRALGLLRGRRGTEAELARLLVAEIRRRDRRIAALTTRIEGLVGDDPLRRMPGVGALTAARILGETGDVGRFRSADAFAAHAGAAPIPASSGRIQRVRLSRGGNRQLNRALYSIALTQIWNHPPARAYIDRKRSEGKTWREAMRCLKRHLARRVFELLQEGAELQPSAGLTT